jgi:hypothetical protein
MTSGEAEKTVDPELGDPEPVDAGTEALQRSQDAIDQGRDAAQEALKDNPPGPEQTEPLDPEG